METELSGYVRQALGPGPDIQTRQLFGCPAYFVGRRVFMCLDEGRVGLKLPPGEAEEAKASLGVMDFSANGRAMPSWVGLELTSSEDLERYASLVVRAVRYAQQRQAGQGASR